MYLADNKLCKTACVLAIYADPIGLLDYHNY